MTDGSALFVSVPELLASLKFAYERKDATEPIMDPVLESKFVVLDDIGAEREGEWTFDQLYLILNYRQSRLLPTIVTTNLSQHDLQMKVGARAASRIFAFGPIEELDGRDYRDAPPPELADNLPWIDDDPPPSSREATVNPPEPGSDFDFENEAPGIMLRIYQNMGHANGSAYEAFWAKINAEYRKKNGHPPNAVEMKRREMFVRMASNGQKVSLDLQSMIA